MTPGDDMHRSFGQQRVFGSLDGIRALSILAVIWHHGHTGGTSVLSGRGFLGVDMFFVLSGFLIVTLLLREQERTGGISLRAFYARRSLRIMPLYYGVVVFSAVLFGVVLRGGGTSREIFNDLPYLLTYTTNWVETGTLLGITWSLAAEEQFYLLWPPIQKFLSRPPLVLGALLLLIALSQVIHLGLADTLMLRWFGASADEPRMLRETTFTPILLGVLLAYGLHFRRSFSVVAPLVGARFMSALLMVAVVVTAALTPPDLRGWPRLLIHLLMTALLASCVVREDHGLSGLLGLAPLRRMGVVSYGMYLWHIFVEHFATAAVSRGMPAGLVFPCMVAGTLVVAELSFRFYETPFLRMKARFAKG